MFSAMSYGSISYNAHESLARAAEKLGTYYNTGEGGLHQDFYKLRRHTPSCRSHPAASACNHGLPERRRGHRDQDGAGRKAGHRRTSAGQRRLWRTLSSTRMIPGGLGRHFPRAAPRYLLHRGFAPAGFLAQGSHRGYTKPVIVKIAAVHNVAAIASGIARSGADIIAIDGFRGGTGAAPTRIRDNVGIPIELALAAVDQRLREEGIRDQRVASSSAAPFAPPPMWSRPSPSAPTPCYIGTGGADGAGLPPVPHLPDRQVQLGHRHPASRPGQAPEPGHRLSARWSTSSPRGTTRLRK